MTQASSNDILCCVQLSKYSQIIFSQHYSLQITNWMGKAENYTLDHDDCILCSGMLYTLFNLSLEKKGHKKIAGNRGRIGAWYILIASTWRVG